MVVDISGYVGTWPYWGNHHADATGDGLVRLMDQWGVDKSFVTSMCGVFYDDGQGNEMVFDAVSRHPDRLLAAVTASTLSDRDNREYIEQCARRGARMLRLYPAYHGYRLTTGDSALMKLVKCAHACGMVISIPVRLIMNWGLSAVPVSDIIAFVGQNGDIPFIVDCFNAGEYLPLVGFATGRENLYLGTTALTRYHGIEDMVGAFGSGKILAGLAAPHQYVACGLDKIQNAEIPPADVSRILGGNAAALFGLDGKGGTGNAH